MALEGHYGKIRHMIFKCVCVFVWVYVRVYACVVVVVDPSISANFPLLSIALCVLLLKGNLPGTAAWPLISTWIANRSGKENCCFMINVQRVFMATVPVAFMCFFLQFIYSSFLLLCIPKVKFDFLFLFFLLSFISSFLCADRLFVPSRLHSCRLSFRLRDDGGLHLSVWNDHYRNDVCVVSTLFMYVCLFGKHTLHWVPLSIRKRRFMDSHCSRWAWTCYEEARGREEKRWWCYLFAKCFSHCCSPLVWTKGLGEGDNVTRLSQGKVIYCFLSAHSTGQDTSSPVTQRGCHLWCSSIWPGLSAMDRGQHTNVPASQIIKQIYTNLMELEWIITHIHTHSQLERNKKHQLEHTAWIFWPFSMSRDL